MSITTDQTRCPQDHACPLVDACPVGAITQDGHNAPVLDTEKCVDCEQCVFCCPKDVFNKE